jgi:Tol biopolymer transport system component
LTLNGAILHGFDHSRKTIKVDGVETIYNPVLSPDGNNVAAIYQDREATQKIVVFDLTKQKVDRVIEPPSQYIGIIQFTKNGKILSSDPTNEVTWMEE